MIIVLKYGPRQRDRILQDTKKNTKGQSKQCQLLRYTEFEVEDYCTKTGPSQGGGGNLSSKKNFTPSPLVDTYFVKCITMLPTVEFCRQIQYTHTLLKLLRDGPAQKPDFNDVTGKL